MSNQKTIQIILFNESPDILTDHDAATLEAQDELSKLYAQPDEPLNAELMKNLSSHPDDSMPGDTLDQEVLDETNILYKVDDIDTDALSSVLELHKKARGVVNEAKESDPNDSRALNVDIPPVQIMLTQSVDDKGHLVEEVRGQDKLTDANFIMNVIFDGSVMEDKEEQLKNANLNRKQTAYWIKREKVMNILKPKLDKARKEYKYWVTKRDKSVQVERVQASRNTNDAFTDIKRYQRRIETIEEAEHNTHWKSIMDCREKEATPYLNKFVDYQQSEIKEGREPKYTRADIVEKYPQLKRPTIPAFVPSWKKEQLKKAA